MPNEALFQKIDRYTAVIRDYRPLSASESKELDSYFKIGTTYSSNALEGNSLTFTETKVLLEDGLTAGGKPIRDCYEATGHARAYDYMLGIARNENLEITEEIICQLHYLFYLGIDPNAAGKYRTRQVFITGTEYVPPAPEDVPACMKRLVSELSAKQGVLHPVAFAAYAHRRLVDVHPFEDGNGRTARLLMNLILVNQGFCVVSIPPIWRHRYIAALQQAQQGKNPSDEAFVDLIAECEIEAQKDYCRLFHIKVTT